jgi:hypothetical protein
MEIYIGWFFLLIATVILRVQYTDSFADAGSQKYKKLTLVRRLTAAFSVQISLQNNSCLSVLKFSESKNLINIFLHMLSL